ncbi:exopolyphosphatase [bacterium]|nr:exopolyphosphatase [bacterium]
MRLVTRADADGLCCAVFLKMKEKIECVEFVHPKDMQDKKVNITENDIIANLPYHPNCALWFDHHASSAQDAKKFPFKGNFRVAPSAARVVYEYFKDPAMDKHLPLLTETDKMDSAQLDVSDVTDPKGYILMMYTLDPRSGLGPFKDYFLRLVDWIIEKPIVSQVMKETSHQEGNVIITDLRKSKGVPAGNRFLIFTLFPQGNVQARIFNGKAGEFIVVAMGHSIFNRTCKVDLGALCAQYGGGGHAGAATCQLPLEKSEKLIPEIIQKLKN